MAISTTLSAVAASHAPAARPSFLSFLVLAAAGMTQRWRQQTVASCRLLRASRARIQAEAARRDAAARRKERDRLPHASAQRGVANLQMMAADCAALAHDARAAGWLDMAAMHQMEAEWFTAEAARRGIFLAVWPRA